MSTILKGIIILASFLALSLPNCSASTPHLLNHTESDRILNLLDNMEQTLVSNVQEKNQTLQEDKRYIEESRRQGEDVSELESQWQTAWDSFQGYLERVERELDFIFSIEYAITGNRSALDEPCSRDFDCENSLVCDTNQEVCRRSEFSPCQKDSECLSGYSCEGESCFPVTESCSALKRKMGEQISSGVHLIHPKNARNPYYAYCDMEIEGGGWTLVWKMSEFEPHGGHFEPSLRGAEVLLNEEFGRTSSGSIREDFSDYSQVLFKHSNEMYLKIEENMSQWWDREDTGRLCRSLEDASGVSCRGIDCQSYNRIYYASERGLEKNSGFMIGPYVADNFHKQCGEVWCAEEKHGRYDGNCANGPKGEGNWMLFLK